MRGGIVLIQDRRAGAGRSTNITFMPHTPPRPTSDWLEGSEGLTEGPDGAVAPGPVWDAR